MKETAVSMTNISFAYEQKNILKVNDFKLPKGVFMGLIGPNGGGKTTFVKLILGLLKPDQGSIHLFGQPLHTFKNWHKIGFVSQKANTFNKGFPATVFEVVSMGLSAKIGYFKRLTKKHKQKIRQTIDQVGMSEHIHENIGKLSGGQQQRVFIARSLVSDPDLLILDEPTVGVDPENIKRFYELLHELNEKYYITLLLVTHDTTAINEHASDIIYINQALYNDMNLNLD